MPKRGNNVYHRADGRWEGRYYYKGTGKYRSVYGKTMTEAREKLDRIRNEVFTPSKKCYFSVNDIMNMWLESRRNHIKESSLASYKNKIEKHILTYFNGLKYSALTADMLEKFISDKKNNGLSAKYIADMVIMIKSVAKWAETTHNFLNQVRNVELPKVIKKKQKLSAIASRKHCFIL